MADAVPVGQVVRCARATAPHVKADAAHSPIVLVRLWVSELRCKSVFGQPTERVLVPASKNPLFFALIIASVRVKPRFAANDCGLMGPRLE